MKPFHKKSQIHTLNLNIFLYDDLASSPAKISSGSLILIFPLTPNISTVIIYNSELDLKFNFGPDLEFILTLESLELKLKNWHQKQILAMVSFFHVSDGACDGQYPELFQ